MKYFGYALLVGLAFFLGVWLFRPPDCGTDCRPKFTSLAAAEFQYSLVSHPGTLLDIRTAEEYATGHLTDSQNIDYYQTDKFMAYLDSLNKQQPYYVYCRTGKRSALAIQQMRQKGFTDVTELSGGISAWQSAGLLVVK
jgi:rhodanese-related sulfurtransferase